MAPKTAYIHEPFNIGLKLDVIDSPFPHWFQYICDENAHQFEASLHKVITYSYPLASHFAKAQTPRNYAKIVRDQWRFLRHKARKDTPIIKDPIALFSAPWLAKTFDMNVLVMIRHPAAFCSSLKLKDWKFDFNNFLLQPLLIDGHLKSFKKEIEAFAAHEQDIISQAIVLWNSMHYLINVYKNEHPNWLFVRHEDLSIDPVAKFQSIYGALQLQFTPKAKSAIQASSGEHNPAEQQAGSEFKRNSRANIHNWKKRLTEAEILRIKEQTHAISKLYYSEHEW